MGNKNRNRVKKSISPFVKWGKWGGDGVKAFVYAIIFTIVGSDGSAYLDSRHGTVPAFAQNLCSVFHQFSRKRFCDGFLCRYDRKQRIDDARAHHVSCLYICGCAWKNV